MVVCGARAEQLSISERGESLVGGGVEARECSWDRGVGDSDGVVVISRKLAVRGRLVVAIISRLAVVGESLESSIVGATVTAGVGMVVAIKLLGWSAAGRGPSSPSSLLLSLRYNCRPRRSYGFGES